MFVNGFIESVKRDVLERRFLKRGQTVVVAVSGGVDSMVLLHVLHALASGHGLKLVVAHFNHRLRGRSSDADERFVRATAKRKGVRIVCRRGDVRGVAERTGVSIEMAARRLRHEFLVRTARLVGAKTLALGHHADDQVEWFFVKLLRGSGGAPMRWSGTSPADSKFVLVRPLLGRTREEIGTFAKAEGIRYREDASNASAEFLRNRVRHELIPLLEKSYQPALRKVVLREIEITAAESDLVRQLAAEWRRHPKGRFDALPVAVQRRVLLSALEEQGLPVTFENLEALRRAPGRSVSIASAQVVHDGHGGISRVMPTADSEGRSALIADEIEFRSQGAAGEFDGLKWRWRLETRRAGRPLRFLPGTELFDTDRLGARVQLRHWLPGDRFQPIGMRTAVKLQDLFTNAKVPRAERHQRVVAVTEAGEIWWVEGLRIGEHFKVSPETRRMLRWSWSRA